MLKIGGKKCREKKKEKEKKEKEKIVVSDAKSAKFKES